MLPMLVVLVFRCAAVVMNAHSFTACILMHFTFSHRFCNLKKIIAIKEKLRTLNKQDRRQKVMLALYDYCWVMFLNMKEQNYYLTALLIFLYKMQNWELINCWILQYPAINAIQMRTPMVQQYICVCMYPALKQYARNMWFFVLNISGD